MQQTLHRNVPGTRNAICLPQKEPGRFTVHPELMLGCCHKVLGAMSD